MNLPLATEPARAQKRLDWTHIALANTNAHLARASTDAGFRSYWRTDTQPSRIVMDSPPELEDIRPWLRIHSLLDAGNVRVPQVLAVEHTQGFMLMEDLGGPTLLQTISTETANSYFKQAIGLLLQLQAISPPADLQRFDAAQLQREAQLFEQWFVQKHLGLELNATEQQQLNQVWQLLADNALQQPSLLIHRDFMPRNLMPVADGLAVLDFQDAAIGPFAYDVMSLFKDAFMSWPLAQVDQWVAGYHARALDAGLAIPTLPQFQRDADWIGMQRHLKILGIFSRLHYRDNKPHYLEDAPRFIAYLDDMLIRYPEFAPLQALLDNRIKPALDKLL